jgi:uncharacterized repeat protein (TIGR01451 family)
LGEALTYTIVLDNSGIVDASGVIVSDTLPLGVVGQDLNWVGMVPAEGQVQLVVAAEVTTDTAYYGAMITNTAHVRHSSWQASATATFAVQNAPLLPLLSIGKTVETASSPVRLQEPITYTIVVANRGLGDAADVMVFDHLPQGVTGNDLKWTGTVQAGGQVAFTLPAVVTDNLDFGGRTITNTATFLHPTASGSASVAFTLGEVQCLYLPIYLISGAAPPIHTSSPGPLSLRGARSVRR